MAGHSLRGTVETFSIRGERSIVHRADRLEGVDPRRVACRPFTVKVFLENLCRNFDPRFTDLSVIQEIARGGYSGSRGEFPFYPGRVLMQDFTGVPALVDLAAMRSAARRRALDPHRIQPCIPIDLIVDHSVQVDSFGTLRSFAINLDKEYERNGERYRFLKWSQESFRGLRVVPPGNGICHQVNLEHLAQVIVRRERHGVADAFPDTLIGTDSHTTMVNGVSVLGWGVGGIEAEAVLLGEPYFLGLPKVLGVRLTGRMQGGTTATDAVLTITRELRKRGVVGKFVEFTGPGRGALAVPDRATISNMCPEYGATAALWPVDTATLDYLRLTGREDALVERVEQYSRSMGLWGGEGVPEPEFDEVFDVDLSAIVPSLSGPRNPEETVPLPSVPEVLRRALGDYRKAHPPPPHPGPLSPDPPGDPRDVKDGYVAIAAITSCTNTSNPQVMVGAALLARKAAERGLRPPWWVKTSLAPGSKVVTDYLRSAGLLEDLERIGFDLVGYGCTTCIGNSGPLVPGAEQAVRNYDVFLASVLSGNRNFEARIHNHVRANFLGSPLLVVAYALAGRADLDLTREPLGVDRSGHPVFLKDLWPTREEVRTVVGASVNTRMFREEYRAIFEGGPHWSSLDVPPAESFGWPEGSTYLREPPYFTELARQVPQGGVLLENARVLALFGDAVSTDHISPAGEIPEESPAGKYLREHGVPPGEFNTYGSRRGNHEVMIRGTFANVRIRNELAEGKEGGWTQHQPSGDLMSIYDASVRYRQEEVPLVVLAGQRYGQGSSRDWAAKGPALLGVRAILAESFERIHRSNLVGMGVLPLEFPEGQSAASLGLTGTERFTLRTPADHPLEVGGSLEVSAQGQHRGGSVSFPARCRVDSGNELDYWRSGGILPYVFRRMLSEETPGRMPRA